MTTINGYGNLVVTSIENYENIRNENELDQEILLAEENYQTDGKFYDAKEVLKNLRRKRSC